jgi:pimeloyl-ACP methyl ester carboxylesterase
VIPRACVNGIEIEYGTFGDASARPLVLIAGLGGEMVDWADEFCGQLAGHGFYVVRFDNRDSGLSTQIEGGPAPDVVAAYFGDKATVSYSLEDMAADTAALMDYLAMDSAHLVGASMGGMIAQLVAIHLPDRVRSLCSIMSTTGDRSVGQPTAEALTMMARPPSTAEEAVEASVLAHKLSGSPGYPVDEEEIRREAERHFQRGFCPDGVGRQLCAILAAEDRTAALAEIRVPTLVIHGSEDTLVTPSGGEATAKAVPGAELVTIEGMGHELPSGAWPRLIEAIVANAARADGPGRHDRRSPAMP